MPVAERPLLRLLGLALLPADAAGNGLLLPRCGSVHTFGMRFPLDLTFLDRDLRPIDHVPSVPPNRIVSRRGAGAVLERPARGEKFGPSRLNGSC